MLKCPIYFSLWSFSLSFSIGLPWHGRGEPSQSRVLTSFQPHLVLTNQISNGLFYLFRLIQPLYSPYVYLIFVMSNAVEHKSW